MSPRINFLGDFRNIQIANKEVKNMNLPIEFETRMTALLGGEYEAFYEALCHENAVKGLRVNTNKVSVEAFTQNAPFPMTAIDYVKGGFIVSEDAQAGKNPYHHAGAYYMQDPGAMASVAALPDALREQKSLKILDVCAAPGGKTTQLAALCRPMGGAVVANEYVSARSRILAGNVERMGLDNVCVLNVDSKYLAEWYPALFDLVAVDAPCSGEGMYRKTDLAITEWSPENVKMCAARQEEILENAAKTVAPNGYLLYSTCTYSLEENEETVAAFLDRHCDFSLCKVSDAVIAHTADGIDVTHGKYPELINCRRFYPHLSPGEGQFVALLRRDADASVGKKPVKDAFTTLGKNDRAVAEAYCRETVGRVPTGLGFCGSNVIAFEAHETLGIPLPPFGVVAAGVALGEVRKGRIVPHHHFFMAYGAEFLNKCLLDPNDSSVERYLAGEEIDVSNTSNGLTALCLSMGDAQISLGGGKLVGGRLKNYYPKGLRAR